EARLFEAAQADSLHHFERQVFLKSRIFDFEDEGASPVLWWVKAISWVLIIGYVGGLAFYIFLFGVRNGEMTVLTWMAAFWLAFIEEFTILIPLKLSIIYLFIPSLMRYRMQPSMFCRIPRHAPSIQVARRRPDLQASNIILQGRMPEGSKYEDFIPLYRNSNRWLACFMSLIFIPLALVTALPDTIQDLVS
ncbi:unnamed protein product, partial [Choristocarpus tenellus]